MIRECEYQQILCPVEWLTKNATELVRQLTIPKRSGANSAITTGNNTPMGLSFIHNMAAKQATCTNVKFLVTFLGTGRSRKIELWAKWTNAIILQRIFFNANTIQVNLLELTAGPPFFGCHRRVLQQTDEAFPHFDSRKRRRSQKQKETHEDR